MSQLLLYSITANISATISCIIIYLTSNKIQKHEIPFFFMFYRVMFTLPVIAWGVSVAQNIVLLTTTLFIYYIYKKNITISNKWKPLTILAVFGYTLIRHYLWKGDIAFVLFYTIAVIMYTIIWYNKPFPVYGLNIIFSLSMICDMREIIYLYDKPLHWLIHLKPITWILLLPLVIRINNTEITWKKVLLATMFLALSNILDYTTAKGILQIARYISVTFSELVVRLFSIPAPAIFIAEKGLFKKMSLHIIPYQLPSIPSKQ